MERVGVEGTGTLGAGLTRLVRAYGLAVVEVARPDPSTRRWGKSDPIDAQAAARATLAGVAVTTPKTRDGQVEMIRLLGVARRGAMQARVAAAEQLSGVLDSAPRNCASPAGTHNQGAGQGVRGDAARAADQPNGRHQDHPAEPGPTLAAPPGRTRPARHPAPGTGHLGRAHPGGPARSRVETAGQLLVTAGDNPQRLRSEAALAHLCGAAPSPRLLGPHSPPPAQPRPRPPCQPRLWRTALVRMRCHPPTRASVERRTNQGLSKLDILRCLKRYIARELYHHLTSPHPVALPLA